MAYRGGWWGRGFAALLLLAVGACGKGERAPVYPVRGQVLFRGRPPVGARVVFHPRDGDAPGVPLPGAWVEEDGSFRLSTYLSHDGAPAGLYRVTVVWPSPTRKMGTENVGPDRFAGRFRDPAATPLRAEVRAEDNDLGTFRLN